MTNVTHTRPGQAHPLGINALASFNQHQGISQRHNFETFNMDPTNLAKSCSSLALPAGRQHTLLQASHNSAADHHTGMLVSWSMAAAALSSSGRLQHLMFSFCTAVQHVVPTPT